MRKVYLDHAATTPLHPEVFEAMLPYLRENFGNPSSLHDFGAATKNAIEEAREKVAELINANPNEIIFTSGGTEANNFALKGIAFANRHKGSHIIVSQIEHYSVMNSARVLDRMGFNVTYMPVDKYGLVDPQRIAKAITKETILVSIMHANSEVGTIEPIEEIAKITKEKGIYFHTDAVATVGTIPVDVAKLGVDLLSLSANQFYGPKGVGALFVRRGVRIMPFMHGGIQEDGFRAGTENVPGIVGLGKAAEIAKRDLQDRINHLLPLRDRLMKGLSEKIGGIHLTGHPINRLPSHVSVCVEYIEGESMLLLLNMNGIAASSGSACTSRALKASHVLVAMGVPHILAQGSLVFTLGYENTEEDIDYVLEVLPPIVQRLREISPLYGKPELVEKYQKGEIERG